MRSQECCQWAVMTASYLEELADSPDEEAEEQHACSKISIVNNSIKHVDACTDA